MALMKNALTRPAWRGRTNVDLMTITAIEQAERLAGFQFEVTQGSYQGGAGDSRSAGTHDAGGVVDLRTRDLTADQKRRMVRSLRRVGFAAWLRTPAQGFTEHVHAVLGGHPLLHPTAAAQWRAYLNGRNGLASNGPDDGPRIHPTPTFNPDPTPDQSEEDDDMWLDDAINVHDPAGRAETQQVTGRELLTALAIFLNSQPGPHQAYLEAARKSKVE